MSVYCSDCVIANYVFGKYAHLWAFYDQYWLENTDNIFAKSALQNKLPVNTYWPKDVVRIFLVKKHKPVTI